ncbi:MAG: hypothetical protein HY654_13075 [Acidobacteria bacterium]|nr:hypothetical protein [Acidobacteriota bacterium]
MKTSISRAFAFVVCAVFSIPAFAAPCTTPTPDCTEWVTLGGGPARSLIYRNLPLAVKNDRVTRALIVVHGAGRDADNYFMCAAAAAFLAGALEDTIVISPRFASADGSCKDVLAEHEVSWTCSGNSWRSEGPAIGNDRLTSYDFYLLGGLDTLPLAGFDSSCSAMAQGLNRLARGQAYANYVSKMYGAPHKVVVIPLCGHNGRCMYTMAESLRLLFPTP